jgi:putative transposase
MRKDHVWSYDMVLSRTTDGRPVRALVIIDEYTRECLSLYVSRRISSQDVLDQLYELFISRGTPEYIRSDNGPEFTTNAVRN